MPHAVLLGDSIFDNGAYVGNGPDVAEQLRSRLSRDWQVTLLARDGAVSLDVLRQLTNLPADATHIILSAGGNDALGCAALVNSPAADSATLLSELVEAQNEFISHYRQALQALARTGLPRICCTVYDAIPDLRPVERMALSLFNDVIARESFVSRNVLVDLRNVCTDLRDYSEISPIEPSEIGGAKITQVLHRILTTPEGNAVFSLATKSIVCW